ncbi:MAG TPA: DUF4398 domain-containing protein [Steroidobacteraceae bacterium]|nr:DUF4398 domain-containing protein [Steroidobacteraceae bacterium]
MRTLAPLTIVLGCAAIGCASTPLPTAEVARAQTLVAQAESSQAQQYAAADLDRARTKLQQANKAMDAKKPMPANQFATEAAADAEVAIARSQAAQAEKSAAEVDASVEALRSESQRNVRGQ